MGERQQNHTWVFWERRGAAIYTEGNGEPGNSALVAELHPVSPDVVERLVESHNVVLAEFESAAFGRRKRGKS